MPGALRGTHIRTSCVPLIRNARASLVDAENESGAALEVANQCEVRQAVDQAPRLPIAGAPLFSVFREDVLADLLLLDGAIALYAMHL